ncbi:MAG: radical SAM protein, partial [Dehalococcoidia bacterium]
HDSVIVSSNLYEKTTETVLEHCANATCLGITAMTGYQITAGLKMAGLVKERYPGLPVVWGGRHPTLEPGGTIESSCVDILVRGQGERTFAELADVLARRNSLAGIVGISYKSHGEVFHNPDRPLEDVNGFPPMPYDLIDVRRSLFTNAYSTRALNYISSYGCPFRCGFCSEQTVWQRRWLALGAERMAEEIERLVKDYGVDTIAFSDSEFFIDKERVRLFCQELIRRKLKINWCNANGRMPQLLRYEEDMWRLIVESGCREILVGAESGYQPALDLMQKDMRVEETVAFAEKCREYDIKVVFSMLCGLPWDCDYEKTEELTATEVRHTLDLADTLIRTNSRNRIILSSYTPYPGSPLYTRCLEIGLKPPDRLEEWGDWIEQRSTTPWVGSGQTRKFEVLNYLFFFLDSDSCGWLSSLIRNGALRLLFKGVFKLYGLMPRLRWRFRFFALPADCWPYRYMKDRQRFV